MEKNDVETSCADSAPSSTEVPINGEILPKVHFNLWQTLGMNFSITCTPLSIGAYLSLIIGLGGAPFYIWGFLFASVFQLILGLVVAEIASGIPHSSGPAFWVQHLAPPGYSKFMGFLVGWTTTATWWFFVCAINLYLAQLTLGLAQALNPGYDPPEWQYYLVYCAWTVAVLVINLPRIFAALGPLLMAGLVIINATALFILVTLLVRSTPKPSAKQVFVDIINESGWSSNGVVFFLALLPATLCVTGFDAVTHITDEVDVPTKQVPQVIIGSALISAVTGFAMTIVYSFSIVKPEQLLEPYGHQPLLQLLFDSCRSKALATIGAVGVIVAFYIAGVSCFTSWNRLYWSLSREGHFPLSKATSKLASVDSIPVNAMIVNFAMVIALGAIQLGSLTALNGILGGAVVCVTVSYFPTLAFAIWRGQDYLPSERWLNLGRLNTPLRIVALIWCVFISVWLCFPLYLPVTPAYMNWTAVVAVGVLSMACAYWFVRPLAQNVLETS